MEAFRQIVDIKNHTLNLLLPDKFKNGKFEVIVLPIEKQTKEKKKVSFTILHTNIKNYKFNRNEANER